MRPIKFRAWDKSRNMMTYPFELRDIEKGNIGNQFLDGRYHNLDSCLVMQFTGLHDKNKKDIYEGDIVRVDTTDLQSKRLHFQFVATVEYKYGMFCISERMDTPVYNIYDIKNHIEVIGNVFENPELLKEKKT